MAPKEITMSLFSIIENMITNSDIHEMMISDDSRQVWQLGNPTDSHGYQSAARVCVVATIGNLDFAIVPRDRGYLLAMSVHGQHYSTDARRLSQTAADIIRGWNLF